MVGCGSDAGKPRSARDADVESGLSREAGPETSGDAPVDAFGGGDSGGDAAACFPLFHACAINADCCAPSRCLNITGTPACQQEGPAVDGGP